MEQVKAEPVAKVRVTHSGYGMELATHIAYALPEGEHWLYAGPLTSKPRLLTEEEVHSVYVALGGRFGGGGRAYSKQWATLLNAIIGGEHE